MREQHVPTVNFGETLTVCQCCWELGLESRKELNEQTQGFPSQLSGLCARECRSVCM